jgi:NADPH:quinone reductase-like Zn-dependent oxidoreductase
VRPYGDLVSTVESPWPATFPLEQAAAAHRALEAGKVFGKAVLII